MPIHNDPENDNELINQSIPVTTIARLFKELSFKDPQTRITLSTLELSSEYIKLFINEAIIRANEERIDEGDTLVQIDGIDNVTSTAKNNQETQYPTIDEIEDSMRIDDDDDSNNINIGTVNEDDDDELIDDDYFQDESDTQRQLRQAMDAVNDTTRNNNHNNNRNRTTTTTTNNNNNNSQLPAPHQLSYNNYFNSPNMQPPPPMKYTPGRKQQQQQNQGQNQQQPLQLYQGDNNNNGTNTNSKFNSIAGSRAVSSSSSSAVSIASSISTNNYDKYDDDDDDDNSNDLFSSSRRFMNYSNYSSSTINGSVMSGVINNNSGNGKGNGNGGSGTPISENDSPIYTKTRLCNMIH